MNKSRHAPDIWLLLPILALLAIGMVMVYSAGSVLGFRNYGDSFYFVKRQMLFAGLGLIAMFITANTDYLVLKRFARPLLLMCFALLVLVLIPGIGVVRGGARSWLGISSFGIQPSEFMKMGMILFLAKWLGTEEYDISSFMRGLLPPLALIGSAFALIMLQPDLGTGTVMFGAAMMMVFTAGARMKHLLSLGALGLAGFAGLIAAAPYRLQRITAFLDPWSDPLGAGYQIIQSLYAVGPGGLGGLGFGMSHKNTAMSRSRRLILFSPYWPRSWDSSGAGCAAAVPAADLARNEGSHEPAGPLRQLSCRRNRLYGGGSGRHQHRCGNRPDSGNRHHASAHQLWRLFAHPDAHSSWHSA